MSNKENDKLIDNIKDRMILTSIEDFNLHIKAGLVGAGINADGEQEYIGTDKQWDKFRELASREEALIDLNKLF